MTRQEIHNTFARTFSSPRLTEKAAVTLGRIKVIEDQLETIFPASYVSFLIEQGPLFTPAILDLVTGGETEDAPEGASFDVQEFFEPEEVANTHRLYSEGGMEAWLIPIAMDCMGNVFGFRRERTDGSRPDDRPLFIFDHDYCKISEEAGSFDSWLESFLHLKK